MPYAAAHPVKGYTAKRRSHQVHTVQCMKRQHTAIESTPTPALLNASSSTAMAVVRLLRTTAALVLHLACNTALTLAVRGMPYTEAGPLCYIVQLRREQRDQASSDSRYLFPDTLLTGTPSRWGNLPEHIDVARSMTLVRIEEL